MSGSLVKMAYRVGVIALLAFVLLWPATQPAAEMVARSEMGAIGQTETGVGGAFDGSHVWYTLGYSPDTTIYRIDPATDTVTDTLDMFALTGGRQIIPGGLAWDANREHLWVGAMMDLDATGFGDGEIFEIDPVEGTIVSSFPTILLTQDEEPLPGIIDSLAFDAGSDTLWFSPLESLHVYQVTTGGALVSSFTLPFPAEIWNAGLAFDESHLWLSLRTGGINRGALAGFTEVSLAEFTRAGDLLGLHGFPSDANPRGSEDLAFDAVTFAPQCVVWLTSIGATLTSFEVPCPLRTEPTLYPSESAELDVEVALDALAAGGIGQPSTDVSWSTECQTSDITVTLDPEVHVDAEVGTTLLFGETIEVSGDAVPGTYHCAVTFSVNALAGDGVPFEQQMIWITVLPPEEHQEEQLYEEILVDIKPGSCRNPLNVKSQGVLPVAILGTESFDVSEIDTSTIELYVEAEGIAPLRWSMEDVGTAYESSTGEGEAADCSDQGPDGYVDLTLKFDTQAVVALFGEVSDGDVLYLEFHGLLFDGTEFEGGDSVEILKKGKK